MTGRGRGGGCWIYPIIIVVDVETLVSPHVARSVGLAILGGRADKAPHGQLIYKEFIPAHNRERSDTPLGSPVSVPLNTCFCCSGDMAASHQTYPQHYESWKATL
jgi:hypothetical protein